ncbi:NADH:flavin oxidoreductase/NADH oxidase [Oharaeibacter diazotrophicus]|uniref:2,4-dienoyl-CoA reductase-like NADH-dependent reductase (Old Yellow Enzyme family) n=1 Tax=Oharaeibacter diazotrophicus TaxID=1920512 RepID=A0A4R6RKA4_9HYPH|nr:NADH:flavin oxidoreductase/NADH oxidase [Oharaeibacter diazotrophicus]TDP86535.1 2,4-dienoyl-CoA reductase-like NADH-dependent reductase (Old Yellow Enzyme family) [Oharaeibacter diazotrophicus]BBE71523.1 NADPH dehydrogenase [Pleomorphomonas sp. SM30]GLS78284.1 NADH:flavin oxidoreductase / NADH oxidase [Oharaeibacter diazotrophicus]
MPALFTPFRVRDVTFRNRIVLSPMCQYAAVDGRATDWHFDHHARFALGGVGGAVVESTGVLPEGRITPDCLGLWDDSQIPGLARIAATYRRQGAAVGIQLAHAGRKASSAPPWDGGRALPADDPRAWPTVAPSAIAYDDDWPVPHALAEDEIAAVIAAFGAAARRAVAAGFDFVEIHGAHGYLIHSFVSPVSNRRTDRWGGSAENRMRLPVAVAEAVRAAIPPTMPLFYRASCIDRIDGAGLVLDDAVALARALKPAGVDVVDCSAGGILVRTNPGHIQEGPAFQVGFAATIRREAGIATMAVGAITEPRQAEAAVADGSADLVAIGRELLADSNFARRAAEELGLDRPDFVLPDRYAFYLQFRRPRP